MLIKNWKHGFKDGFGIKDWSHKSISASRTRPANCGRIVIIDRIEHPQKMCLQHDDHKTLVNPRVIFSNRRCLFVNPGLPSFSLRSIYAKTARRSRNRSKIVLNTIPRYKPHYENQVHVIEISH